MSAGAGFFPINIHALALVVTAFAVLLAGGTHSMLEAVEAENMDEGEVGVTVSAADSGREIYLKKGEVLRIELRNLGTAGYSWQFERLDREYLEITHKESRPVSGRMGAPAVVTWTVKAIRSGTTRIEMCNYRVWEGKEKSVKRFSIDVKIE